MAQEKHMFSQVAGLQKSDDGTLFLAVLFPNPNASDPVQLKDAIKANKCWLDSLLHQSSAILFRGFTISNTYDFNDIVDAFGYDDFPYAGITSRTNVYGRVYTANESPPEQMIGFHHELCQGSEFPSKLFFFCESEPRSGGETCIVPSHVIYEKMKRKHPEFVEKMEEKGMRYVRLMRKELDPSSPLSSGWKAMFETDDKNVAEERAKKQGIKLEWMEDVVKVIIDHKPCFKYDEAHKRMICFNQLASLYAGLIDNLNNDPAKAVMFGDGEPLPPDIVHDLLKMMDEECLALKWRKGDVLLIDNLAVLHARRPVLAPPCRILASFCK